MPAKKVSNNEATQIFYESYLTAQLAKAREYSPPPADHSFAGILHELNDIPVNPGALQASYTLQLCGVGGSLCNKEDFTAITVVGKEASEKKRTTPLQALIRAWGVAWDINHTRCQEKVQDQAAKLGPIFGFIEKWGVGAVRFVGTFIKQASLVLELPLRALGAGLDYIHRLNYALKNSGPIGWCVSWLFWPVIFILKSLVNRLANVVAYTANLIVKTLDFVIDLLRLVAWGMVDFFNDKPTSRAIEKGPWSSLKIDFWTVILNFFRLVPELIVVAVFILNPGFGALLGGLYALLMSSIGVTMLGASIPMVALVVEVALSIPAQLWASFVNWLARRAELDSRPIASPPVPVPAPLSAHTFQGSDRGTGNTLVPVPQEADAKKISVSKSSSAEFWQQIPASKLRDEEEPENSVSAVAVMEEAEDTVGVVEEGLSQPKQ